MPKKSLQFYVFWLKYRFQYRGIAKLVRHQVLILASVGSSPATPAIFASVANSIFYGVYISTINFVLKNRYFAIFMFDKIV